MTRDGHNVRTIYDDRGGLAGYVWQKRWRTSWNATLFGFCERGAPQKRLGSFPKLGGRRPQGGIEAMTDKGNSEQAHREEQAQ